MVFKNEIYSKFLNISQREKFSWTSHVKMKMRYYGLSEKRILKIFRRPDRREEGIVPKTIAAMQISGTKKRPTEVWMMYQTINLNLKQKNQKLKKIRVISAWRYPGRTPENARPIIPDDIAKEINTLII